MSDIFNLTMAMTIDFILLYFCRSILKYAALCWIGDIKSALLHKVLLCLKVFKLLNRWIQLVDCYGNKHLVYVVDIKTFKNLPKGISKLYLETNSLKDLFISRKKKSIFKIFFWRKIKVKEWKIIFCFKNSIFWWNNTSIMMK